MEVLDKFGSEFQKQKWLQPLLNGEIRSAFAMTEPNVASSDATNIESRIEKDGKEYVINGEKWWTSGIGRPDCKVIIFMGVTNPNNPKHQRQSQILIPTDAKGIENIRMLTVYGADHAPNGHAHLKFKNVRVPEENLILGEGRGFEIAQGRLGPGRIHHCMRIIGIAERALDLLCKRSLNRRAFGKPLSELGGNYDVIADCRIEIEKCIFMTLKAAQMMETEGKLPDTLIACIGGGSNALGLFYEFLDDSSVEMIAVEAAGHGIKTDKHAASLTGGKPGVLHGNKTYLLQSKSGQIQEAHSISAGLDYPGIGPEHSFLFEEKRVTYMSATDKEALEAFQYCCKLEGIIPALEPAHALAVLKKIAKNYSKDKIIVMNMCGRGDNDIFTIADELNIKI